MAPSGPGRAVLLRRLALLKRCARGETDATELGRALDASPRTIASDLAWAKVNFPGAFMDRTDSAHRKLFRFIGELPVLLDRPIEWLSNAQLVALVAARGLLRMPSDGPTESADSPYGGLLDGAMHDLLRRAGLLGLVRQVAPETIQVSRFGARPEDPTVLARVVAATVRQEGLRFDYLNRWNESHPVHAAPRRLVLIRGEFHCFMWTPPGPHDDRSRRGAIGGRGRRAPDVTGLRPAEIDAGASMAGLPGADGSSPAGQGRIKQYRVSRMTGVEHTPELPRGCPVELRQRRIDKELAEAFETTGSADPDARVLVRLAVSPEALPHLEGRTFGGQQRWSDAAPSDVAATANASPRREPQPVLPLGWRRLEFFTTGLDACKYWVLGFGRGLRAESPPDLVRWLRDEVAAMANALGRIHQLAGLPATARSWRSRAEEPNRASRQSAAASERSMHSKEPTHRAVRGSRRSGEHTRDAGRREASTRADVSSAEVARTPRRR